MQANRTIESLILNVRGRRVILDADLAALYEVSTKRLNEQVKRNLDRFPEDFMLQLTPQEWLNLKSQFATSSLQVPEDARDNRSQSAADSHGGRRRSPRAFTEHGAIMAATVLNSPEAVAMSVYVVRAFVQMREQIAANAEVLKRLAEIDKTLLQHDKALQALWGQLKPLLAPPAATVKRQIGFKPEQQP